MMDLRETISGLRTVCALFSMRKIDSGNDMPDPALFGTFGAVLGAVLALSAFCCHILFPGIAGGIAAAVILPFAYETFTSWRGLYALTSAMEMRFAGKDAYTALTSAEEPEKTYQTVALMTGLYLLRMLCFGKLAMCGNACFLVFAFSGDYLIRGRIAGESFDGAAPLLESQPEHLERDWVLPATASVFSALLSLSLAAFAGLFAVAVLTVLILFALRHYLEPLGGAVNLRTVNTVGYAAGTVLLLAGLAVMR